MGLKFDIVMVSLMISMEAAYGFVAFWLYFAYGSQLGVLVFGLLALGFASLVVIAAPNLYPPVRHVERRWETSR
jgi:hypothetical protein